MRETDRQTDNERDRQTDNERDRQTDRQTDIEARLQWVISPHKVMKFFAHFLLLPDLSEKVLESWKDDIKGKCSSDK